MSASSSNPGSLAGGAVARPLFGLPDCHSRREHDPARNIYFCAHPRMHVRDQLVHPALCRMCRLWPLPPPAEFRPYPGNKHVVRNGPCRFLGSLESLRDCPTCNGRIQLKVYHCLHEKHEVTTIGECSACLEYEQLESDQNQKII